MLRPENGYIFVEVLEDEFSNNKSTVILGDNFSRDEIVKARVRNDYTAGICYGRYNDGEIVLCDTAGAREFFYNDTDLKIITEDRVFGVFHTEKNTKEKIKEWRD